MNETLRRLLFLPDQASTFAQTIDQLHYFVIITTFIMSTAVGLTAILFFILYRRRSEAQTTPHIEPGPLVESAFIVIPLAFFLLWWVIGYRTAVELWTRILANAPANASWRPLIEQGVAALSVPPQH